MQQEEHLMQKECHTWRCWGRRNFAEFREEKRRTSGVSDTLKSKPPLLLRHAEPLSWPCFRLLYPSAQLQIPRSLSAPMKGTASPATAFSFILNCNWTLPLVSHPGSLPPAWPSQSPVIPLSVPGNQVYLALKLKSSKTKICGYREDKQNAGDSNSRSGCLLELVRSENVTLLLPVTKIPTFL